LGGLGIGSAAVCELLTVIGDTCCAFTNCARK